MGAATNMNSPSNIKSPIVDPIYSKSVTQNLVDGILDISRDSLGCQLVLRSTKGNPKRIYTTQFSDPAPSGAG